MKSMPVGNRVDGPASINRRSTPLPDCIWEFIEPRESIRAVVGKLLV